VEKRIWLEFPDLLGASVVPQRNKGDKAHLEAEIQTPLPLPLPLPTAYCLPPPPASYLYPFSGGFDFKYLCSLHNKSIASWENFWFVGMSTKVFP